MSSSCHQYVAMRPEYCRSWKLSRALVSGAFTTVQAPDLYSPAPPEARANKRPIISHIIRLFAGQSPQANNDTPIAEHFRGLETTCCERVSLRLAGHPGWHAVAQSQLTSASTSQTPVILPLSLLSSEDYRHHPNTQLIFAFFVKNGDSGGRLTLLPRLVLDSSALAIHPLQPPKMEFHSCCSGWSVMEQSQLNGKLHLPGSIEKGFLHVDQAGLQLLTSGDLPASASQSAGIIGAQTLPATSDYQVAALNPGMMELLQPQQPTDQGTLLDSGSEEPPKTESSRIQVEH
ncbi:hypothetical protein AAY473_021707, partial [Plecturocebus cupreus]